MAKRLKTSLLLDQSFNSIIWPWRQHWIFSIAIQIMKWQLSVRVAVVYGGIGSAFLKMQRVSVFTFEAGTEAWKWLVGSVFLIRGVTQCPAEPGVHSSHCRPLYSEATLRLASDWSHSLGTGLSLVEAGCEADTGGISLLYQAPVASDQRSAVKHPDMRHHQPENWDNNQQE